MGRNRWDDEYDSYQEDHNDTITIDPTSDTLWYQSAQFDAAPRANA